MLFPKYRYFFQSLIFGAAVSFSGTAYADVLTCKFTELKHSGGYIPSEITLEYDEAAKTVSFLAPTDLVDRDGDAVKPILSLTQKGRITFTMTVKTLSQSNQKGNMKYRLTWIKKNNRATVQAIPLGYSNQFRAGGRCENSAS